MEVSGDDRLHYQQSWSPSGALLLHDGTVCWKGQEQTNQPGRNHLKLPLIEAELSSHGSLSIRSALIAENKTGLYLSNDYQ